MLVLNPLGWDPSTSPSMLDRYAKGLVYGARCSLADALYLRVAGRVAQASEAVRCEPDTRSMDEYLRDWRLAHIRTHGASTTTDRVRAPVGPPAGYLESYHIDPAGEPITGMASVPPEHRWEGIGGWRYYGYYVHLAIFAYGPSREEFLRRHYIRANGWELYDACEGLQPEDARTFWLEIGGHREFNQIAAALEKLLDGVLSGASPDPVDPLDHCAVFYARYGHGKASGNPDTLRDYVAGNELAAQLLAEGWTPPLPAVHSQW